MKDVAIVVAAALVASGLYVAGARPWHALPVGAVILFGLRWPRKRARPANKKGGP